MPLEPYVCRTTQLSGKTLSGMAVSASASPPTLRSQRVATETANQRRCALLGSVMRVPCHCQPPRLMVLKPCSIHARIPYQQTLLVSGGKSVRMNHASLYPSSQYARSVDGICLLLNATPVPSQCSPGFLAKLEMGRKTLSPVGQNVPLIRMKGCHPIL